MKNDTAITLQKLKDKVATLIRERDWEQFHNPKSLSMDIAIEAAELMEKFLWTDNRESLDEISKNRHEIEAELADVIIAALAFANNTKIDLSTAVHNKLVEIAKKYPIEKSKGRYTKYTKL